MNDRREVSCDCFICDKCGARVSFDTWNYARSNKKNPICQVCSDKADEDWKRREQSRIIDQEYVDRRMPYNDTPKKGWWG